MNIEQALIRLQILRGLSFSLTISSTMAERLVSNLVVQMVTKRGITRAEQTLDIPENLKSKMRTAFNFNFFSVGNRNKRLR